MSHLLEIAFALADTIRRASTALRRILPDDSGCVECIRGQVHCSYHACGDSYTVEPDAFGDGAMTYFVEMHTRPQDIEVPHPAHVLIPEEIAKDLPRLYATEREGDPLARVKYFTPDSAWTWFVAEYDPERRLCFGLIIGHERELGFFSVNELEQIRGPLGLKVERDLYFEPAPLSKCGGQT